MQLVGPPQDDCRAQRFVPFYVHHRTIEKTLGAIDIAAEAAPTIPLTMGTSGDRSQLSRKRASSEILTRLPDSSILILGALSVKSGVVTTAFL
jgi:hypothetical protein